MEIGAQWIHGEEGNPIYDLALKNNFVASDETLSSCKEYSQPEFFTPDGKYVDAAVVKETCHVLDEIFAEADKFSRENKPLLDKDESVGTFVFYTFFKYLRTNGYDAQIQRIQEAIFNWRLQMEKSENACRSIYEMSAYAWGEFMECKGDDMVTLNSGYQALLDCLLQNIPSESIRTNTPVQCIYWNADPPTTVAAQNGTAAKKYFSGEYPLSVRTKSGDVIHANHVLVTCSVGVLKKHAPYMFRPILPRDKMAAIHRLGFGTVDKIYLEWDTPWWEKSCSGIQLAWIPDEPFTLNCLDNKYIEQVRV